MIGIDIRKAANFLKEDHVIGFPTETVYGLAGNALSEKAVAKIFSVKQRPYFDPLIIHLPNVEYINRYVKEIPSQIELLINKWMPGPLTVLLDKADIISDLVTAGSPRVAIRIPSHPISHELLSNLDFPLAAPSANPFGYISPTCAQHVADQLGDKIPYILDGGPCQVGLESTIVGMEQDQLVIYRKGGLSIDQIKAIIPNVIIREHSSSNPSAPGMLKSHYAPTKAFTLVEDFDLNPSIKKGYITFGQSLAIRAAHLQYDLSPQKDFSIAAQNIFRIMRLLDQSDVQEIEVKLLPEVDLGIAINDRLRRAAVKE